MEPLEQIAASILSGDALAVRSVVQDWLAARPALRDARPPSSHDHKVLAVAASIVELFAERSKQPAPAWTESVAPLAEPLFLVREAMRMPRLRSLCEREAPAALRKRRIFAPPNYLDFV